MKTTTASPAPKPRRRWLQFNLRTKQMLHMIRLAVFSLTIVLIGCAKPRPNASPPNVDPQVPSSVSMIRDAIFQLLKTPAIGTLAIPPFNETTQRVEIATAESLAADGRRFTLFLDRQSGAAWVVTSGGIGDHISETSGPWPIEHPRVVQLLDALGRRSSSG